ncbi:MAG: hypothetical protein CMJ39_04470 [Phycisphaerae bacterium]|nr:hypothetical protein [Phycisphaerae bacterium]
MTTKTSLQTLLTSAGLLCLTTAAMADHQLQPDPGRGRAVIGPVMELADDGDTLWLSPGEYVEQLEAIEPDYCKSLRIVGTGKNPSETVIRSWRHRHRIGDYDLCPDMSYTFENITFDSHDCGAGDLDGLWIAKCNVRFVNCRFVNIQSLYLDNVDQDPNAFDTFGAIYMDTVNAQFENCTFYNNGLAFDRLNDYTSVAHGGAMHSYNSNVSISDSNFEGNYAVTRGHATDRATRTSSASGGAIYAFRGNLEIRNSRFHENEASSYPSKRQPDEINGGAISAICVDRLWITGCDFEHNSATWGGGRIGGPRGLGGAIYTNYWQFYPFEETNRTNLADNRFYWNESDIDGGAVYVTGESRVKIKRSEFECNTLEQVAGPWLNAGGNEFIEDCGPPCPADLNHDGIVDKFDLYVIWSLWGKVKTFEQQAADYNYDGEVNNLDMYAWFRMASDCKKDDDQGNTYKK